MLAYAIAATLLFQPTSAAVPPYQAESNSTSSQVSALPWGNDDVVDYLTTFGPSAGNQDPFVAPTPPELPETVALTFPIDQTAGSLFKWTYDRERQSMTVVVTETARAASKDDYFGGVNQPGVDYFIRGWSPALDRTNRSINVSSGGRDVPARVFVSRGFGEVYRGNRSQLDGREYRHTFNIEPEAARAMSSELVLRVIGKPAPWRDETQVICSINYRTAEVGFITLACFLTGTLETYQVVDRRDGTVIHEWDARQTSIDGASAPSVK